MLAFTKGCGVNLSSRNSIKNHEAMNRRSRTIPRFYIIQLISDKVPTFKLCF